MASNSSAPRRIAQSAIALISASAVVLSIAYLFAGAPVWWLELTRYAPFPAYLVPSLACVGLSLRLG